MRKTKDDRIDLFLKFATEDDRKLIMPQLLADGSWERYSSTAVRGWSNLNRAAMETKLYETLGYSKERVQVIDGNQGLFRIGF